MPAEPPISNTELLKDASHQDSTVGIEEESLHVPAVPLTPGDELPVDRIGSPDSADRVAQEVVPATPESALDGESTITLTPRQQRVLQYLARRRMRHARIVKRPPRAHENHRRNVGTQVIAPDPVDAPGAGTQVIAPDPVDTPNVGAQVIAPTPADAPGVGAPFTAPDPVVVSSPLGAMDGTPTSAPVEEPVAQAIKSGNSLQAPKQARTQPLRHPPVVSNKPLPPVLYTRKSLSREAEYLRKRRKTLRYLSRKHLRQSRASEQRAQRRLWLTIAMTILPFLVIFLSVSGVGAYEGYRFYTETHLKYEHRVLTLQDLVPLDNLKMYDSKGVPIAQLTDQGIHTTVKFEQIAQTLKDATVATEDKNFWSNQGIDIFRILSAALDDLREGRVVEGGSTITQQLIKNLVVGNQTTLIRKLEETVLTPKINDLYSKPDILTMYLNSIYYGEQAYGIDAAANVYFGLEDQPDKPAAMQLDLAQSAMLASIPSNPSANDPRLHPQAALNRMEHVLDLMVTQGSIKKIEALDALHEAQDPNFLKTPVGLENRAPHFVNFVLLQLQQQFHMTRSQLSRSGMLVYTTLDIALQDKIQKIAQQHIAELRADHHLTNAAEVLIDFHTGAIISLLGSIDYNDTSIDGQFDVATQGYRQPGSSFKPYVYVTAFQQGSSPAQAIIDKRTTIYDPTADPPSWSPDNYDRSFHGHMTLRCALQNSLNVPAVRVLRHVGINAAMGTAKEMGISSYEGYPGYSLVLGGLSIRLIDHTSAMGTFANGGVHVPYYAITKVVFSNTGKVYQQPTNSGKSVISPQLAYMMTSVLSDNASRTPEFYDCNVLQLYSNSQTDCWSGNRGRVRPAAAKTGTTEDFRDNWTVGYTTDYVMGVWAGNNDNTPMIDVTGVQGAAPIWHDAMLVAEDGHPIRDFPNPGGLERATVTYPDGVQTTDWFLPGTVPDFSIPTPTPTTNGTPGPGSGPVGKRPLPPPYCPSSYSFAFPPPPDSVDSSGWW